MRSLLLRCLAMLGLALLLRRDYLVVRVASRDVDPFPRRAGRTSEEDAWARAVEAMRNRDEFLASMSHDLRTPLTAIRGHAQLMQLRAERLGTRAPAWMTDGLTKIESNANRMTGLINELLDLARMQAGRTVELDVRPTDLVALARQAAAEHRQISEGHRLRVDATEPQLIGRWDEARLRRVLDNLIGNALKYSPPNTTVSVRVGRDRGQPGDWAVLSVRDHGVGIPAADLHRIFDRYYRAANVADRFGGTGLGLAAVRQIVVQHGGEIAVDSVEGAGSTFTVRLPLVVEAAVPA